MNWLTTILHSMSRPLKWWVVVATWEQGVRVRLGKNPKRLDCGIHFRIPFLDRVYVQATRLRVIACDGQSITTRDGVTVTFKIAVSYQIRDVLKMYMSASSPEGLLMFRSLSTASRTIASSDSKEIGPEQIEKAINEGVCGRAMGLESVQISVITYCTVRCYRMITGDGWIPTGNNLENEDNSGEVK